jgi:hypothetical protein
MADVKISALNSLAGADLVAADVVAVVDDSASETKKLTVSDLIANGVTLISNATIPSAKILFAAGSVATASVADAGITTAKVADSSITAAKLADNSSVTLVSTLPGSGDFTGQIALDTDDNKIYIWDGSAWDSVKGAGSINVVNGSTSGIVNITTSTSGDTVTVSTTLDDTTAAKQFLAGPTGAGGTVGYRAIASGDLPTATSSAKGAVAVNGNGLTMSNDEIQIDNSVTAETTEHHLVQYDANGLITAGRVIAASDLPEATSSAKGAVVPGSGLEVASGGTLNHTNSTTAGTYTKVTVDAQGHVTSAVTLAAADIPDLDAAKITTGTFPTARLADDAVTAAKLADQSVTKFGGAGATDNVVTFPDGDYKGQFFFDEKNEDLYVYTGESFLPITVISGNLVNAGTYDASTNLLSSVTTAGSAAGFTNGAALPAPASGNLNYYVVVDTSGTGSGNAPAVALAPPDMLISLGVAGTTFQLIDVSNAIAGQTAANISVVATGNIAATDVQAALQELDTEKLAKAGGTMTGNLELGNGIVIVFEGATDDGFETTLTVADPTADRTITLPNETGTLLTTGSSGVVTSTMITDGTIVNADINASAEIAVSKLANGSARQLLQTDVAGTGVEFTSNVDVPGTLDVTGAATFDSTAAVTGLISADGKVKFPAGTASAPSFYFGTDTNTGLYHSAADEVAITTGGTQRVVVDSSGQVGIGTGSPTQPLEVNGTVFASNYKVPDAGGALLGTGGTSNAAIQVYPTAQELLFWTNASERLRINSSGNVGIGVSSPTKKLHVADSSATSTTAQANTIARFVANASNADAHIQFSNGVDHSANIGIVGDGANIYFAQDGTERLRIDSSGKVGIATTSPARQLDVNGTVRIADGSAIEWGGTSASIAGTSASNALLFSTASSERARINSAGNLGVGTSSPFSQLHLNGSAPYFTYTNTAAGTDLKNWMHAAGTDGKFRIRAGNDSNTFSNVFTIDHSGHLGIGADSPAARLEIAGSVVSGVPTLYLNRAANQTDTSDIALVANAVIRGDDSIKTVVNSGGFFTWSVGGTDVKAGTAGASEKMRIDSSGQLLVGTSSALDTVGIIPKVQSAAAGNAAGFGAFRYSNNAPGPIVHLFKSRGTSVGTNTVVQSGDTLGEIRFVGADGTNEIVGAQITAAVDGTPGTNDMPTRLAFHTTADGHSSSGERLSISSKGVVTVKNSSVGEIDALTSASTITPDFAASNNFSVTLGTNATLANPSNLTAGQSGVIAITQDGTGSRTMAFGNKFKFAGGTAPTLTTTASAVDILTYYVESTSRITAQVLLNVS